jgi:hypothetical protein
MGTGAGSGESCEQELRAVSDGSADSTTPCLCALVDVVDGRAKGSKRALKG